MAAPIITAHRVSFPLLQCIRCCSLTQPPAQKNLLNCLQRNYQQVTAQRFISKDSSPVAKKKAFDGREDLDLVDKVLLEPDYFGVRDWFTVSDLFNARVHIGHNEGLRNDYMKAYLLGNRLGQDIFDLDQTADHLKLALNVTAHLAYRQGLFLFVCRNRQNALAVEEAAQSCGEYAHCRYWNGGLFTNSSGSYKSMTRLPDACLFIGTQNNIMGQHLAVSESAKMGVLSIGVVDSDSDPRLIAYPIPGNDDTPSAVNLYCRLFKRAITLGKRRWREDEKKFS